MIRIVPRVLIYYRFIYKYILLLQKILVFRNRKGYNDDAYIKSNENGLNDDEEWKSSGHAKLTQPKSPSTVQVFYKKEEFRHFGQEMGLSPMQTDRIFDELDVNYQGSNDWLLYLQSFKNPIPIWCGKQLQKNEYLSTQY